MPANLNDKCILYWVHDATCLRAMRQGYIGITAHETRRRADHRRKWPRAKFTIKFEGTRRQCLAREYRYRPKPRIGLNRHAGGGRLRGQLSQQG